MAAEKILVTGCRGQLGHDLVTGLSDKFEIVGVDVDDFDICDSTAIDECVEGLRPAIVIHTAAYTDVDGAESNADLAMRNNADGTENIARACQKVGAAMIYYSTDFVFDGNSDRAYTEEDRPSPVSVYGRSKLAGEESVRSLVDQHTIVRLAWVYGNHGKNFIRTMTNLAARQIRQQEEGNSVEPLKVVDDQHGSPTWTVEIVRQTRLVIERRLHGLFHCTAEGETTWYGAAKSLFEILGWDVKCEPCTTDQFPRPAKRPARSTLENKGLKDADANLMQPWHSSLEEFVRLHREDLLRESA